MSISDETLKYNRRGVSADKKEVHDAVKNIDKGLLPNAFCKVLPDVVADDKSYYNVMHSYTAGTKTSIAYLYWKETSDLQVWNGIAQDAIVMNIDDLLCVGITKDIVLSSTIGRNKKLIPGSVLKEIINGTTDFIETLNNYESNITLAGGETADVGDVVRTIDVGIAAFARLKRDEAIEVNIQPGDVIIGLSSSGKASYENIENSGIGCNGLTSARHDTLNNELAEKYPESFDPSMPVELAYSGNMNLTDEVKGSSLNVGQSLLSPTRSYFPLMKEVLLKFRKELHGIIHCTGGGQTKVLHFIDHLKIIKNDLFPIPPVFQLIKDQSNTDWNEMYQVFNMGHRMEIYVNENISKDIMDVCSGFDIESKIIGHCEKADDALVQITTENGSFEFK